MKRPLAAALLTVGCLAIAGTASANPQFRSPIDPDYFCFLRNKQGQVVNLTAMCLTRTSQAVTATKLEQSSPSSEEGGEEKKELLVYSGTAKDGRSVQSYLQYEDVSALNGVYKAWFRREFPNAERRPNVVASTKTYVEVVCSSGFRTTQSREYDYRKVQVRALTGTDVKAIEGSEKAWIQGFFCQLPRQVSSEPGRCDYPWQKDSKGRYCGNRAKTAMFR